jgi:phage RecT family recombinase
MDNKNGTFPELEAMVQEDVVRDILMRTLPRGTNVDAWLTSALMMVRQNKDLRYATTKSSIGAFIRAAGMGLRLEGLLGEAYLVAYKVWDKSGSDWIVKEIQTQLQIGYVGLIRMALRNPEVQDCEARIVYRADQFDFDFGSKYVLQHTWDHNQPRGLMSAVYASIRLKNGYYKFSDPYPMDDIEEHRERILRDKGIVIERSKGKVMYHKRDRGSYRPMKESEIDKTPWIAYFKAMAMKTAVRWASKYWGLGESFDQGVALVALDDAGKSQEMEAVAQQYINDAKRVDTETKGSDHNIDPTMLRPFDGERGQALKDRMLAEVQGTKPTKQLNAQPDTKPAKPVPPTDSKKEIPITPEEEAEILAREQAEAEAYRKSMNQNGEES